MADKQNIPKGKMHSNCRLLPEDIVCKITQRNNIRRANTCDPALKLLNEEITSDIQKHKQNIWKEHLDAHWDHRHNTHTLWKTIHGLSNRAPRITLNNSISHSKQNKNTPKQVRICEISQRPIQVRKQITTRCNMIEDWVHLRCAGIRLAQYTYTWTCHQHKESRLTTNTDLTPPHHHRPWLKPPTPSPQHHHNQSTDTYTTKQFTNTVKHAIHKTNRSIDRAIQNIQGYNITLTTSQVHEAIKQSNNNNSQGPDKLNIRHLKHIHPLGLVFLTSMLKTAPNNNIIPDTWKLANIVPIPKPNKDTDKGTSYRPISMLSIIANTMEKSLLPYITTYISNTPMQHGYKTQHSSVTALHTLNNTVAKWFNQMAPPARIITVALDVSKAFDTINIHTLIRKLLQTNIPGTIIRFIANYIKGHKVNTTYRNHTSRQRQLQLAFQKVASFHPHYLTFTLQTTTTQCTGSGNGLS